MVGRGVDVGLGCRCGLVFVFAMFRFIPIILLFLIASPALALPPSGAPLTVLGTCYIHPGSAGSGYYALPFRGNWDEDAVCYITSYGGFNLYLRDDGDGTYSIDIPDFGYVDLEKSLGWGWGVSTTGIYVIDGYEYGVGTHVEPTIRMFTSGFAAGVLWLFVFWLLVGLVGLFRRAAWRFS